MDTFASTHPRAISFAINKLDRCFIPCFDVSRSPISLITHSFIESWREFIAQLIIKFKKCEFVQIELWTTANYATTYITQNIILPAHFTCGILDNYPDLYECNSSQVCAYLKNSNQSLKDIYIRTGKNTKMVNMRVCPETFMNLNTKCSDIMLLTIDQQCISPIIIATILIWWNNHLYIDPTTNNENTDNLVYYASTYCAEYLFKMCNYYVMLYSRAITINNVALQQWLSQNLIYVEWDDDMLSDVPSNHIYICRHISNNTRFQKAVYNARSI